MAAAPEAVAKAATPPSRAANPLFQHILGGIGQPSINIAGIGQSKTGSGMGGVSEHIGGGLVNGHRPGIGSGIGLFLAHVEL